MKVPHRTEGIATSNDVTRCKDSQGVAGSDPAAETLRKPNVAIEVRADRFYFVHRSIDGEREVGPFRSRSEVDEVAVAAELSGLGPDDIEQWRRHPGINKEKWIVQPQDVLVAKLNATWCMPYKPPPTVKDEERRIHTQISNHNAEQFNQPFDGKLDSEIRDLESATKTFHIELRKAIEEKDENRTREIRWWILITEGLLWPKIREWLERNPWRGGWLD